MVQHAAGHDLDGLTLALTLPLPLTLTLTQTLTLTLTLTNTLQDTTSMVFTKQYGFRFSSCEYRGLADKQGVRTAATQPSLCLPWLYCPLTMAARAMAILTVATLTRCSPSTLAPTPSVSGAPSGAFAFRCAFARSTTQTGPDEAAEGKPKPVP